MRFGAFGQPAVANDLIRQRYAQQPFPRPQASRNPTRDLLFGSTPTRRHMVSERRDQPNGLADVASAFLVRLPETALVYGPGRTASAALAGVLVPPLTASSSVLHLFS